MSALPSAVFRWSTPLVVPGPTPWPVADLHRVVDLAPLRAWLDAHGYGDATVKRTAHRLHVELPALRQPDRGAQLEGLAHVLRHAGLEVEEHRVLHVAGLWIDDPLAGERMPVETCAELAGRANEALPPAYSATGPGLPVCGAVGAPCVDAWIEPLPGDLQ